VNAPIVLPLGVPDIPRWIEANAIAADPASWQRTLGAGRAVASDSARLIVVLGDADPAGVAELARERPSYTVLCALERQDLATATGREVVRALLHTLADPAGLPMLEGAVALPDDASLDHLPGPLAEELADARGRRTIWTAYLEGAPVAFAYAPWRSAGWFDVSIDTLPSARQLGLGRLVAAAMIRDERALGREPVWGADEGNVASQRLAHSLGFEKVDEIWVAV
jgi:GNAT superfamily N-acetyltransferase